MSGLRRQPLLVISSLCTGRRCVKGTGEGADTGLMAGDTCAHVYSIFHFNFILNCPHGIWPCPALKADVRPSRHDNWTATGTKCWYATTETGDPKPSSAQLIHSRIASTPPMASRHSNSKDARPSMRSRQARSKRNEEDAQPGGETNGESSTSLAGSGCMAIIICRGGVVHVLRRCR